MLELEKKLANVYREAVSICFATIISLLISLYRLHLTKWRTRDCSRRKRKRRLVHSRCMSHSRPKPLQPLTFLSSGDFADALGEDYLGLRELGIAAELGLSNLTIPKSLFKRKKGLTINSQGAGAGNGGKRVVEKPLDYPLPPPFLPFTYSRVGEEIGLLKNYYEKRFEALALAAGAAKAQAQAQAQAQGPAPMPNGLPGLPGPSLPNLPGPSIPASAPYPPNPYPGTATDTASTSQPPGAVPMGPPPPPAEPAPVVIPPDLVLPDDPIPHLQTKMGPLGQITKPAVSVAPSKKKKPAAGDDSGAPSGPPLPPGASAQPSANGATTTFIPTIVGPNGLPAQLGPDGLVKKKKGATGVGSGNGRKVKKDGPPAGLVLPVSAATSQGSGSRDGGGSPFMSPVIASSA